MKTGCWEPSDMGRKPRKMEGVAPGSYACAGPVKDKKLSEPQGQGNPDDQLVLTACNASFLVEEALVSHQS